MDAKISLARVAQKQRVLVLLVAGILMCFAGQAAVMNFVMGGPINIPIAPSRMSGVFAIYGLGLLLRVVALVVAVQLMAAMGVSIVSRIILIVGLFLPLINLLVLLSLSVRATNLLKARGVRVGFLGVDGGTIERLKIDSPDVSLETDPFAPE